MSVKNVYLKKKISGVVYDIYPHTDAGLVAYDNTTVAAKLAALATGLASVITEQTVDTKISTATTNLYNQIMGFTDAEGGHTISEAYDTLKEVADYLSGDGGAAATLAALASTVGDANGGLVKDVADLETTVGDSTAGLVKDVADLETTVGDSTGGLVKDVADNATAIGTLETTVGDSTGGLVKDVADNASDISALQTAVSGLGGVYVVASVPNDADENSLYIVVEETPSEEPSGD